MLRTAGQRCWQIQPLAPPSSEHVPALPLGAPSSELENSKEERMVGVP